MVLVSCHSTVLLPRIFFILTRNLILYFELMKVLCSLYGISKSHTISYPPCNGRVGRMNLTLINMLHTLEVEEQSRWPEQSCCMLIIMSTVLLGLHHLTSGLIVILGSQSILARCFRHTALPRLAGMGLRRF